MSNRYKTTKQSLPIAAWVIGCCVAACIVGFGVKFLMVKYQVFQGGRTVKEMEVRLSRLTIANEALESDIVKLTSGDKLKDLKKSGFIRLRDIVEERDVVRAGRDDKTLEWKDGVAVVASRQSATADKKGTDAGGPK
jgi:hypothetical protein